MPQVEAQEIKSDNLILTSTWEKITHAWLSGKRRIFVSGGTTASKTFSAMQFLTLTLKNWKGQPLLATVTSESLPHSKGGTLRDFHTIMGEDFDDRAWRASDFTYTWPNGCVLEWVSGDHPERFAGPRRHIWFLNELNNIKQAVYREGDLRTSMFLIADWNPYGEFWFHDEMLDKEGELKDTTENVYISGLTFKDTPEVTPPGLEKTIESYKDTDPNFYRVHALGLMGKIEGLVYPKFDQVDKLPDGEVFYGIDWGFTSDPTALCANVIIGDNLYSQELLYSYDRLTTDDIAMRLDLMRIPSYSPIYCDGNDPRAAEELRRKGYNAIALCGEYKQCMRMNYRIQKVNQYNQHWTKDSINGIKEQRNYRFIEDRNSPGTYTEKTTHRWSHLMSAREFGTTMYKARVFVDVPAVSNQ